jgi:hypothetical protein
MCRRRGVDGLGSDGLVWAGCRVGQPRNRQQSDLFPPRPRRLVIDGRRPQTVAKASVLVVVFARFRAQQPRPGGEDRNPSGCETSQPHRLVSSGHLILPPTTVHTSLALHSTRRAVTATAPQPSHWLDHTSAPLAASPLSYPRPRCKRRGQTPSSRPSSRPSSPSLTVVASPSGPSFVPPLSNVTSVWDPH